MSDSVTRETVLDLDRDDAWRAVTDAEELRNGWPTRSRSTWSRAATCTSGSRTGASATAPSRRSTAPERARLPLAPGRAEADLETVVRIELEPAEQGTRVIVVETGFEALPVASAQALRRRQRAGHGRPVSRLRRPAGADRGMTRRRRRGDLRGARRPHPPARDRRPCSTGEAVTASELARDLPITRQAVAKHLADAGRRRAS